MCLYEKSASFHFLARWGGADFDLSEGKVKILYLNQKFIHIKLILIVIFMWLTYFNISGFSLCYKLCYEGEGNTISMPFMYEDIKYHNLRRIYFKEHPMWTDAMI